MDMESLRRLMESSMKVNSLIINATVKAHNIGRTVVNMSVDGTMVYKMGLESLLIYQVR